ncbi:cAMP-dependent protein kinase type II regulatory subunit-like isoform X3 [Ostrea edulis]|uniref:cAMP-dependent protein kinase type II regulatory subunit-like isoform X3 n=1 Tax=Ostrea edulis TaxID=37623 RepID=UPI00209493CB|nr:cAMP-dependent protein kinase type II regulatory subunit-like isoform X3 [Ostrea edulis]
MSFEIPTGLTDLLQDFTVAVLKERPSDLTQFAADYFVKLNENKNNDSSVKNVRSGGVRFAASPPPEEPMQTDSDDEEPEPPPNLNSRGTRRGSVFAAPYNPESDDEYEKIVHPKSDVQRQRLAEAVRHILLFRSLEPEQMQEVLDAMFEKKVVEGDHVIDQGDDGDNFYVIESGYFDIIVNSNIVGKYENKGSFGELALMYNQPRAATIVATSEGSLWAMDRETFRRIVLKNAYNKRKMYENLLENVPMLKTLDSYERMNVADALLTRSFEDEDIIIKQGDEADCMYFIENGEVRVTVKNQDEVEEAKDPESKEVEVKRYTQGGYFGELALVTHKARAATAYSVGKTKCAVLDVQAFERLLGPCMDIMKRNIDQYEEQLIQISKQHL